MKTASTRVDYGLFLCVRGRLSPVRNWLNVRPFHVLFVTELGLTVVTPVLHIYRVLGHK
jgi:hypothetical protein